VPNISTSGTLLPSAPHHCLHVWAGASPAGAPGHGCTCSKRQFWPQARVQPKDHSGPLAENGLPVPWELFNARRSSP